MPAAVPTEKAEAAQGWKEFELLYGCVPNIQPESARSGAGSPSTSPLTARCPARVDAASFPRRLRRTQGRWQLTPYDLSLCPA